MKKLLTLILSCNMLLGQTFNDDFLDGVIIFKTKNLLEINDKNFVKTSDQIGAIIDIKDYPQINEVFKGININKFERPSYFTGNRELQKIYRIIFSDINKIDSLIDQLNELQIIEYAEKEPIYKTTFIPNDTYHNGTDKWYHTLVNSEQAWDISLGSESVKIAIIDNGAPNHADLNIFKQRDVSDNDNNATPPQTYNQSASWSHGTHCAGLATAEINNSNGIASIGGNVELIVVKATGDNQNPSSIYNSYAGVQWACENGANVVSMSYGSENSSNALQDLINAYPEVVFIAAAGNDGTSDQNYPAAYQNVIGVGSVDSDDTRSSFSNYNVGFPWVDISAPGGYSFGGLLSSVYTENLNGYAKFGGTSMATPFAAGLIGLMLSINPSLTPLQIQSCLINSGVDINQNIGPRIDAYQALLCAQPENNDNPIPAFTASPQVTFENQPVFFSNNSVNANNWIWTFEGGTPSTYEGQNPPEIYYSTVGEYNVSLTVTNSSGDQTLTKENYITVYFEPSGEWILQNTTFSNQSTGINYISIADENVVWATAFDGSGSGLNTQQFTKTVDGGDTWQSYDIDVGDLNLGISMIHAHDDLIAWLVAYPRGANQIGGIFKTIDGGNNWVRQDSALYNTSSSFANVVYFWDENIGFAQGDPINGEFELYVTDDGGENWVAVPGSNIPNPLGGEYGYTRQIEISGNNVWFTTNKGRIYKSNDRGNNWIVFQSPISDFGSAEISGNISFSDSENGILIDNNANVFKSTDGGATWNMLNPNGPVYSSGLCYIEGTNTVYSTGSGSSFSLDGGLSWTPIDTAVHLYVDFFNEEIGWSGGWTQVTGTISTGGVWKWEDFSLSINSPTIENPMLDYYPNPTDDFVNFIYEGELSIEVYDIYGRKIINSENKKIDLRDYNNGVYIFKIWDYALQKSKSIRIIKR